MLLLLIFIYLLFGISPPKGVRADVFWLLITTSVVYLSFIGLLVPVLGNLVRYKALVMPLFLGAFLLIQKEKWLKLFLFKMPHHLYQLFYSTYRHGIINRSSKTTYRAMPFDTYNFILFSKFSKCFFESFSRSVKHTFIIDLSSLATLP
jgi:hypothetical protein